MNRTKDFQIYCQFRALAKKTVKASSLKDAVRIAESKANIQCDEIVRLIEPCKVDIALSHKVDAIIMKNFQYANYKNWGSE